MTETKQGLYVGLILNLAVAAVLNNTFFEASTRVWLATLGAANELLGVLLVASPELLPRVQWFARWLFGRLRSLWHRLLGAVRRLFRRRRLASGDVGMAIESSAAIGADAIVIKNPPEGTTEEIVSWLVSQDRAHQEHLQKLESEIKRLPEQWQGDIDAMRDELVGLQQQLVRRLADARIRLRLLGLGYVVFGLVLAWLGNIT